ncbi:hypothetical protein ATO8_19979 [Roseivivax marinus]|uniref:Uncharacterized protein n=1 Tax=Roseivivax marinus TaxID=1379903 RepID=W4HFK3_9RHOB|nr:hypothetical protein [Roseivivax marinus]ETW10911.1 hypothetical protein ATO8_19979 [Roseivivax marinus]
MDFILKHASSILAIFGVIAAATGAWFAHRQTQARNTWRLEQMERRADILEKGQAVHTTELASLHVKAAQSEEKFGFLQTTLEQMRDVLIRIENRIEGKQDK